MKEVLLVVMLFCALVVLLWGCGEDPESYDDPDIICSDVSGKCTPNPSDGCSPGYEPHTANDPEVTDCLGQCCVEAPYSTCSMTDDNVDCIPGTSCGVTTWRQVQGRVNCEEGRVCCFWAE
ncbi:MAG: hypothetical protein GY847_36965 [Proteobacteria bacterium]|nr:hypothetical protein [Pseudomonadota bacterium]